MPAVNRPAQAASRTDAIWLTMLYHYTDRLSTADIVRDKIIRAMPATLHRDMLGQDAGYQTEPIVWLTTNPILDGTVFVKMLSGGWPKDMEGNLCRFCLRVNYPSLTLADFVRETGMDANLWQWAVRTGKMAGSHYTTWRLCRHDVPSTEWLAVEKLRGIADGGETLWENF